MKDKIVKTISFDNAKDGSNYLYGVDDGQEEVPEYSKIKIKFIK